MSQQQDPIAISELLERLLGALDFAFLEPIDGEPAVTIERQRYATALVAFANFLSEIGHRSSDRFFVLSEALTDLDVGANPPLLKRAKVTRVPNSSEVENAKAEIAFALEALIELGGNQDHAAMELLQKFPAIKFLARAKSHRADNTWSNTILEWRKALSAPSRGKGSTAAEMFAVGRQFVEKCMKEGKRTELRDHALGRAKNAAKTATRLRVFATDTNTP